MFAIRNGEQILREYNPSPMNPSTPDQVEARAKLKLISQLSAVMAPVIAIPRQGAVSSRNMFTKVNYKLAIYSDNEADIALEDVQLTKSVVGVPNLTSSRTGGEVTVSLARAELGISRMVYAFFIRESDNKLRFVDAAVVNEAGVSNNYPATVDVKTTMGVTVLAYGVRDNTEAARAYFGDLTVTAENIAKVVTSRRLTESDITLTETRGINVPDAA